MVLVLFEVTLKPGSGEAYLAAAARLKAHLEKAPGFIRSERFSSLTTEGKLLSLSVWESEEAVARWRTQQTHRESQRLGRETLFESYRITVASPLRSYTDTDRQQAPRDADTPQ